MFVLSTNNNNPSTPQVMNYKVTSLLAVALAFTALTASANTTATVLERNVQMELNDAIDGGITMTVEVLLPDGTVSIKSKTFRTMEQAVDGYVRFVTSLPYGSTLIRVEFTDRGGNLVFAAQG